MKLLVSFGITTIQVVDCGAAAIEAFRNGGCDIVLMGASAVELNAWEATKAIRALEKEGEASVPIVAMMANAKIGEMEQFLSVGMDDYVSKPIDADQLKEMMRRWIVFDGAAVDLDLLRSYTDGDVVLEKKLVSLFIKQTDASVSALRGCCNGEAESVAWKEKAHLIKGCAVTIGARALGLLCEQAQNLDSAGKAREPLLIKIEEEYQSVKAYLIQLGLVE